MQEGVGFRRLAFIDARNQQLTRTQKLLSPEAPGKCCPRLGQGIWWRSEDASNGISQRTLLW